MKCMNACWCYLTPKLGPDPKTWPEWIWQPKNGMLPKKGHGATCKRVQPAMRKDLALFHLQTTNVVFCKSETVFVYPVHPHQFWKVKLPTTKTNKCNFSCWKAHFPESDSGSPNPAPTAQWPMMLECPTCWREPQMQLIFNVCRRSKCYLYRTYVAMILQHICPYIINQNVSEMWKNMQIQNLNADR